MMNKLQVVSRGLARRFPNGNTPFMIMTRLLEECGELAEQVNHFEDVGIKRLKHGEPDKTKMAKEVMDVIRCVLHVVDYYDLEPELEVCVEQSFQRMKAEGFVFDGELNEE